MIFPSDMEPEAKNLIDRMLDLDPVNRIGCGPPGSDNSFSMIKSHPFFDGIDFRTLHQQKVPVPQTLMNAFNKSGTVKRVNLVKSESGLLTTT